jgi:Polysulphide reductase, NrfD
VSGDAATGDRPNDSYYGQPIINPPVWEEREIAGYLFCGGLAGASSILAAVADGSARPRLADRARLCASAAVTVSFAALIKDLGRPARFVNMLRVFKPTSPMSVGTWILSAYAPLNYLIATAAGVRRSRIGAVLTGVALLSGSALTRFGLFAAGMESARDPRYTVQMHRARADAKVTLDVYPAADRAAVTR